MGTVSHCKPEHLECATIALALSCGPDREPASAEFGGKRETWKGGGSLAYVTFKMIKVLVQHEADKEAERCLTKFQNSRLQNELITQEK